MHEDVDDLTEEGWSFVFEYLRHEGYEVEVSTSEEAEEGDVWFEGERQPGDEELIASLLERAWHYAKSKEDERGAP
ncbi:MAG: hypothetical protein ACXWUG_08055 [Polyangiales bacterium]